MCVSNWTVCDCNCVSVCVRASVSEPCLLPVRHLYLMLVHKHTVVYEACRLVPAALQCVQVEVVERAVSQEDSHPRTPVVS